MKRSHLLYALILSVAIFSMLTPPIVGQANAPSSPPMQDGDDGGDDDSGDSGSSGIGQTISNIVQTILHFHEIEFDTPSLFNSYTFIVDQSMQETQDFIAGDLDEAEEASFMLFMRFSSKGLLGVDPRVYDLTAKLWRGTFRVSLLLAPLVLLLACVGVLSSGVSAPIARAEMFNALIKTMATLGFAYGSFILLNKVVQIGWGVAAVIFNERLEGGAMSYQTLIESIGVGGAAGIASAVSTIPSNLLGIFVYLFIVILYVLLVAALFISYYALIALTVGILVLAPITITLGAIPELRWIYGIWLKAFGGILLLPALNSVLLRLWLEFTLSKNLSVGSTLMSVLISLGFIGLMITLNFSVGKFVYAPILEAAKSTFGILKGLASTAVGLATGMAAAGASGAAFSRGLRPAPVPGGGGGTATRRNSGNSGSQGGGGSPDAARMGTVPANTSFGDMTNRYNSMMAEGRDQSAGLLDAQRAGLQQSNGIYSSMMGRDSFLTQGMQAWNNTQLGNNAMERSALASSRRANQDHSSSAGARTRSGSSNSSNPPQAANFNTPAGFEQMLPALANNSMAKSTGVLTEAGMSQADAGRVAANYSGMMNSADRFASSRREIDGGAHTLFDDAVKVPKPGGGYYDFGEVSASLVQYSLPSSIGLENSWRDPAVSMETLNQVASHLQGNPLGEFVDNMRNNIDNAKNNNTTMDANWWANLKF